MPVPESAELGAAIARGPEYTLPAQNRPNSPWPRPATSVLHSGHSRCTARSARRPRTPSRMGDKTLLVVCLSVKVECETGRLIHQRTFSERLATFAGQLMIK